MARKYSKLDILDMVESLKDMLIIAKPNILGKGHLKILNDAVERAEQVSDKMTNGGILVQAAMTSYFGGGGVSATAIARLMEQLEPGSTKKFADGIYLANSYYHHLFSSLKTVEGRSNEMKGAHQMGYDMFIGMEKEYVDLYMKCNTFFNEFYNEIRPKMNKNPLKMKRSRNSDFKDSFDTVVPSSSKKRRTNKGKGMDVTVADNYTNDDIEEIIIDEEYGESSMSDD